MCFNIFICCAFTILRRLILSPLIRKIRILVNKNSIFAIDTNSI